MIKRKKNKSIEKIIKMPREREREREIARVACDGQTQS